MKKTIQLSALAISLLVLIASCKKDTPINTTNDGTYKIYTIGKITTVQNVAADTIIGFSSLGQPIGSGSYTLFSLETGKKIANSDSATTKWDIGLRGTTIITNNGTSGPGNGGGFVYVGLFDDLNSVPVDSTIYVDAAPTSYAIRTGSNKGWYSYDGPNNLINPIAGRVLVIKTATGKYAKVEILNYYKGGETLPASASDDDKISKQRYFTFRYTYQGNGTTTF